jgi:hypothetical protein
MPAHGTDGPERQATWNGLILGRFNESKLATASPAQLTPHYLPLNDASLCKTQPPGIARSFVPCSTQMVPEFGAISDEPRSSNPALRWCPFTPFTGGNGTMMSEADFKFYCEPR